MPLTWKIAPDDEGLRVDKFLRRELPKVPLSHIFKMLRTKKVRVNDKRAKGDDRLRPGDTLVLRADPERLAARPAEVGRVPTQRRDFEVLHQDDDLLAVVKPAGLAIHPGTGISGATLVDQVRAWLGAEPDAQGFTPSPAHRLDKETSGVVLVARTRLAMKALTEAFTEGRVKKTYLAVVKGRMPQRTGEIDLALQEHQQSARSKELHGARKQRAHTRWVVREVAGGLSLIEAHPGTGRTHQIRRHLAAVGHPIVGDRRYGDFPFNREAKARFGVSRQLLHAWRLTLEHPITGARLELEAPPPPDFVEAMRRAGLEGPGRR